LAVYLGHPISQVLSGELERIKQENIYQPRVFFIRNLGFITPTEARQIGFEESLRFETIHEEAYRDRGFELTPSRQQASRSGSASSKRRSVNQKEQFLSIVVLPCRQACSILPVQSTAPMLCLRFTGGDFRVRSEQTTHPALVRRGLEPAEQRDHR
jgi:hypothetical protein